MKPSLAADADQLMAQARDELDELSLAVALGDAENGQAQNTADFIAHLRRAHSPSVLAALVVAAVRERS